MDRGCGRTIGELSAMTRRRRAALITSKNTGYQFQSMHSRKSQWPSTEEPSKKLSGTPERATSSFRSSPTLNSRCSASRAMRTGKYISPTALASTPPLPVEPPVLGLLPDSRLHTRAYFRLQTLSRKRHVTARRSLKAGMNCHPAEALINGSSVPLITLAE
jgi:hypothetical protein